MVVIDATNLLLLLRPGIPVPAGPDGVPLVKAKERIEYLVSELEKAKTKIVIPTPALSEALVRVGAAATQEIIEKLQKYSVFRIEAFDTRAAIEVAAMTRKAIDNGNKRGTTSATTYAKVKYDRQIVAIARVAGADTIYSDDNDIAALCKGSNIRVIKLKDLPLPPQDAQISFLTADGGVVVAQEAKE
jgi:predicted nucleic acid-binding protein